MSHADSWVGGWTSTTGREFGAVGQTDGTAFVEILADGSLVYLGRLPIHTSSSDCRDMKVIGDSVYIGAEASNRGLQTFDLKKLLAVKAGLAQGVFHHLRPHCRLQGVWQLAQHLRPRGEEPHHCRWHQHQRQLPWSPFMLDVNTRSNPKSAQIRTIQRDHLIAAHRVPAIHLIRHSRELTGSGVKLHIFHSLSPPSALKNTQDSQYQPSPRRRPQDPLNSPTVDGPRKAQPPP